MGVSTSFRNYTRHSKPLTLDMMKLMKALSINANAQMAAFWMLAYLLQRPAFAEEIRAEIAPAMESVRLSDDTDGTALAILAKENLVEACPLLNSAFNEVLRVTSTGSTIRETTRPVEIGKKIIPSNTKVLIPQRLLLLATEGFGPDAHEVDLARFAKTKGLERGSYYRPFGGGMTLCSGRTLGRREVLSFVALILWQYELQLVQVGQEVLGIKGMPSPRLDEGKPSLGIAKQMQGDDSIVKFTKRIR